MDKKYKILIVEDDAIIAQLLEHFLTGFGHSVLDIVHDSEKALDLIHNLIPELVLLDINILGSKDGIEIAEIIDQKYSIPYIFITALSDNKTIQRAQNVSPIAYIVKPFKEDDLRVSLSIGMSNYQRMIDNEPLTIDKVNDAALSPLSEREFDILLELAKGLSNKQIGQSQNLSAHTVKWHTQNIFSKLGVRNRTAAAQILVGL